MLQGDLGDSVRIQKPVTELILEKLPVTIQLAAMAMLIALVIGITAGVISAVKKDTWLGLRAPTCSRCGACRRRISGSASC